MLKIFKVGSFDDNKWIVFCKLWNNCLGKVIIDHSQERFELLLTLFVKRLLYKELVEIIAQIMVTHSHSIWTLLPFLLQIKRYCLHNDISSFCFKAHRLLTFERSCIHLLTYGLNKEYGKTTLASFLSQLTNYFLIEIPFIYMWL